MLLFFTKSCKPVILFVDGHQYFRELFAKILGKGYTIHTASHGLDALKMLHQDVRPDLIITDISMPVMNGLDLIKHIRRSGVYKHVPICILSELKAVEIKRELGNLQVEEIFTKPLDPQCLLTGLEKILSTKETEYFTFEYKHK